MFYEILELFLQKKIKANKSLLSWENHKKKKNVEKKITNIGGINIEDASSSTIQQPTTTTTNKKWSRCKLNFPFILGYFNFFFYSILWLL